MARTRGRIAKLRTILTTPKPPISSNCLHDDNGDQLEVNCSTLGVDFVTVNDLIVFAIDKARSSGLRSSSPIACPNTGSLALVNPNSIVSPIVTVSNTTPVNNIVNTASKILFVNAVEIDIDTSDFEKEMKIWEFTLMGHIIGGKPSLKPVPAFLTKNWSSIALPEAMTNVLRQGPWMIEGNSLILKQWSPSFSTEMDKVAKVPVWILFPGLDPYLWSEVVLSKIASKLGKPLFADLATTNKEKLCFARVMVEIDISKNFVDSVVINTPFLGQITQQVVYEWVPFYCTWCGKLGHKSTTCKWLKMATKTNVEHPTQEKDQVPQQVSGSGDQVSNDPKPSSSDSLRRSDSSADHATVSTSNSFQVLEPGEISQDEIPGDVTIPELGGTLGLIQEQTGTQLENVGSLCVSLGQRSPSVVPVSPDISPTMHSECFVLPSTTNSGVTKTPNISQWGSLPGMLGDNKIDVLALLETRVSSANAAIIVHQNFRDWIVVTNYSKHYNGRIWVLFNPKSTKIVSQEISDQTDLKKFAPSAPWLVLGDFNVVRDPAEKLSPNPPILQEMMGFNSCLTTCHLDDLNSTGCELTWTNKHDSSTRVWSKLDRAFVNPSWLSSFPQSFAHFSESGISDHSPIIVHISEERKIQKRFNFLNQWISYPDYLSTVADAWRTDKQGSPTFCFFEKLKSMKHALTKLHSKDFAYISAKVKTAKIALKDYQAQLVQNPFSESLIKEEMLKLKDFITVKNQELNMLTQRAKIKHLQDSD
ncbi:uncharacterized protein LOC141617971 [Silene latifolia]|uniref:uncharacterized protein LOC141617971 n=1 Tax=Silene latifolia TaxID=37657 RepID=UPI003D776ABF